MKQELREQSTKHNCAETRVSQEKQKILLDGADFVEMSSRPI